MYYAVMIALTVLFAAMSALLLSGRGAFLISGYNTASPEQKAAYDEKKLCRVNGAGLAVITVLLAVMTAMGEDIPGWFFPVFIAVTLADAAAMIVLSRTVCRVEGVGIPEPTGEERRKARRAKRIGIGAGIVAVIFAAVMMFTGDIEMEFADEDVAIQVDWWSDGRIRYEDISAMELRQEAVPGLRVGGLGSARLLAGNFRNDEFGNYTRYTYTACDSAVVMSVKGRTVVLNGADDAATEVLYKELCRRTGLS